MNKYLLLGLFCSGSVVAFAQEWQSFKPFKKEIRRALSFIEPASGVTCGVSMLTLVSHTVRGELTDSLHDPLLAKTVGAGAIFLLIRSLRTAKFMQSSDSDYEQSIKNWEFVGYGVGIGAVGYHFYRYSPEGLSTLSGAKMLSQPLIDGMHWAGFFKYNI